MALNPNHAFEDLEGTKCSIVEKNCPPARVEFLKALLELNNFTVVVVGSPPPKVAPVKAPAPVIGPDGVAVVAPPPPPPPPPPAPTTFTVGVTDLTFDPITAVFNRQLKTSTGQPVSSAFWQQKETEVKKEEWYWKK